MKFLIPDEQATEELGREISRVLPEKCLVFLNGPLGAGKTTLVRGVLRAAGHQGSTKSPTYTLVEPYNLPSATYYHFDLYRLGDPEELEYIGIRDYLGEQAVCLVEWPEKGFGFIPPPDLTINLDYEGGSRSITLDDKSEGLAKVMVETLKDKYKIL